ncbi:hypothetical protein XELAEV_18032649mg [Xenopus laevis]|uniref:Uncharacterized protein n=1 Tax=Xenopus laevis TaxID=8355 RepID=A0A974CJ90_XENLA|nr:hypothetical protein XELAEV_18032649mg [Xenopus laevis]
MKSQPSAVLETLPAVSTDIRFLSRAKPRMLVFHTLSANEWFHSCLSIKVGSECIFFAKAFPTLSTDKWFLSCVTQKMILENISGPEASSTLIADKWFLSSMNKWFPPSMKPFVSC